MKKLISALVLVFAFAWVPQVASADVLWVISERRHLCTRPL